MLLFCSFSIHKNECDSVDWRRYRSVCTNNSDELNWNKHCLLVNNIRMNDPFPWLLTNDCSYMYLCATVHEWCTMIEWIPTNGYIFSVFPSFIFDFLILNLCFYHFFVHLFTHILDFASHCLLFIISPPICRHRIPHILL